MAKNDKTAALIDGILRCVVMGGTLSAALLAPNILQVLDKPTRHYFQSLDIRAQERELRRVAGYMKRRGLLTEEYEHGLAITDSGKKRLEQVAFDDLVITRPKTWDKRWRLVMFDIPEAKHTGRQMLTAKLRSLGFQQLQQSVWIHPHPCRLAISKVCETYDLSQYVSYIVTSHIDHDELLARRFTTIINGK